MTSCHDMDDMDVVDVMDVMGVMGVMGVMDWKCASNYKSEGGCQRLLQKSQI